MQQQTYTDCQCVRENHQGQLYREYHFQMMLWAENIRASHNDLNSTVTYHKIWEPLQISSCAFSGIIQKIWIHLAMMCFTRTLVKGILSLADKMWCHRHLLFDSILNAKP
jgi:hypothetical protein